MPPEKRIFSVYEDVNWVLKGAYMMESTSRNSILVSFLFLDVDKIPQIALENHQICLFFSNLARFSTDFLNFAVG